MGTTDVEMIEHTLCHCVETYATPDKCRTLIAFDRQHGQFVLIDEGWDGYKRIHSVWAHIELQDSDVWIHEDGTEEGIAPMLIAAGIRPERIVLAFHAPILRQAPASVS